jgi:hypothetical protein
MYTKLALVVALVLAGCGGKKDEGGGAGAGTGSAQKPVEPEKVTCPPGNAVQDGKCVAVVTPEKVEAVAKQQTRIDDLAKVLSKVDTIATPIELLGAFRKLNEWKDLTAKFEVLKGVDEAVGQLDTAVKTLRTFKGELDQAAVRLGNLKGELDRFMKDSGAAKQLAEVRTRVSSEIRTAMEPLGKQVEETIKNALDPLDAQLEKLGAALKAGCATLTLTGGGADAKKLCKEAEKAFEAGVEYLADFKVRPGKLFDEVATELEKQFDQLLDAEVKKLLDAAQAKVNAAMKLPPAP